MKDSREEYTKMGSRIERKRNENLFNKKIAKIMIFQFINIVMLLVVFFIMCNKVFDEKALQNYTEEKSLIAITMIFLYCIFSIVWSDLFVKSIVITKNIVFDLFNNKNKNTKTRNIKIICILYIVIIVIFTNLYYISQIFTDYLKVNRNISIANNYFLKKLEFQREENNSKCLIEAIKDSNENVSVEQIYGEVKLISSNGHSSKYIIKQQEVIDDEKKKAFENLKEQFNKNNEIFCIKGIDSSFFNDKSAQTIRKIIQNDKQEENITNIIQDDTNYIIKGIGIDNIFYFIKQYTETFYFSTVTMTTIGYGDMIPYSIIVKVLVVLQTLIAQLMVVIGVGIIFSSDN